MEGPSRRPKAANKPAPCEPPHRVPKPRAAFAPVELFADGPLRSPQRSVGVHLGTLYVLAHHGEMQAERHLTKEAVRFQPDLAERTGLQRDRKRT